MILLEKSLDTINSNDKHRVSVCAGDMAQAGQSQHALVQMALIRAIPCMAMHQTALPFVQRALMPFSQQGTSVLYTVLDTKMGGLLYLPG